MGSLTKKTKAPTIQYVVQQPSEPTVTETSVSDALVTKSESRPQSESRTESLLRRSRGRFGTITTSFRGFLDSVGNDREKAKTLLGE